MAPRGGVFRKTVLWEYDYMCCVSGMCVVSALGVQMMDACHIVPWAETQDDTIGNGISLCPNLHRAFDRGLFRVDGEYGARVANVFTEVEGVYSLRVFEGRELVLPRERGR